MALPLALLAACAAPPPASPPVADETTPPAAMPAAKPSAAPAIAPTVVPPSPQRIATLREWVERQSRLYRVAAPLLIHNTALCKRHARNLLGLTAKTRHSYPKDFVEAAQAGLGLGDRLQVMDVLPGSGAERIGIRKGDLLLAVDGKPFPQGPHAERDGAALVNAAMRNRTSVDLTVQRDGERLGFALPLTSACAFGVELGDTDLVNSYADGHRVMINRGLLDMLRSDEELAYVIAKEIGHNLLTRANRPRMAAAISQLQMLRAAPADTIPTLRPYSPVLDATADKMSLYLLARAGYDIDGAIGFWKRLAIHTPANVKGGHTELHPSTAYRMSVMSRTLDTIKYKRARKQPLLP